MSHEDEPYMCGFPAEPLYLYRKGGYHPITLGDRLGDQRRYKILHKLGWGSFSTVWAVHDERENAVLALKIVVAEKYAEMREIEALQTISSPAVQSLPGARYLLTLHDHFELRGPNGTHNCLVTELTGPSVQELISEPSEHRRLPGNAAKKFAKQVLLGLVCLHKQGIAHGDLHTGNIVLVPANPIKISEPSEASTSPVTRKDCQPLGPEVPPYLVLAINDPFETQADTCIVKINDFGESYRGSIAAEDIHTPLVVRAPEAIFKVPVDARADIWGMACLMFELITGQPPLDSWCTNPVEFVKDMLASTAEELPDRWQAKWKTMQDDANSGGDSGSDLQTWLEELCSQVPSQDGSAWTQEDLVAAGRIIKSMMRLDPAARASLAEVLNDPWFAEDGEVSEPRSNDEI